MRGLCLVLLVIVASAFIDLSDATGSKPNPCGKCGFASRCRKGNCFCRKPLEGDKPGFVCNKPRLYHICEIYSDPHLDSVDSQNSSVIIPATFNLITTKAKLKNGFCKLRLVGYSVQKGGKYFIEALQLHVHYLWRGKHVHRIVRFVAKYEGGKYKYKVLLKNPVGGWIKTEITLRKSRHVITIRKNSKIRITLYKNKFLFVYITCCKVRLAIRPYNSDAKSIIPGVFVQVRKNKGVTIGEGVPNYICNNLTSNVDFDDLVRDYDFRSKNQLLTFFTLENGEILNYPGMYNDLPSLQQSLTGCPRDRLSKLIRNAEFFHNYPEVIACVSEHEHILGLYHNATLGYCYLDDKACDSARDKIKTYCSKYVQTKKEQIRDFLRDGCV